MFSPKSMFSNKLDNCTWIQADDFHSYKVLLIYTNIFTTRKNAVGPLDSLNIKTETKDTGAL